MVPAEKMATQVSIGGKVLRALAQGAAFSLGFAAVCAGIRQLMPVRRDIPVVSGKLAWLAEHGADYDTLFIGTSRMFHQAVPAVFDARMRELGHPTRSYNIAADGMNFPETFHMLELAALNVPGLRTVLVESGALQRGASDESVRAEYWHTARNTWMVMHSICADANRPPMAERAGLLWSHGVLFFRNFAGIGRGQEWLGLEPVKPALREDLGEGGCLQIQRSMSEADGAEFARLAAARRPDRDLPALSDPVLEAALRAFVSRMKASGVTVVFVKMPAFRKNRPPLPEAPVIDMSSPEGFPAFWEAVNRYDPHHLNSRGAALFSAALAEAFSRAAAAR